MPTIVHSLKALFDWLAKSGVTTSDKTELHFSDFSDDGNILVKVNSKRFGKWDIAKARFI